MQRPALVWALGLLIAIGYVAGGLTLRAHATGGAEVMWSRFDEANAHLPEIRRIMAGGGIASATDAHLAMVPGLDWLYAKLLRGTLPPQPDSVPAGLQLWNLSMAALLAVCGAGWLRAVAPRAPPWTPALAFVLLLFSPYTMASGLYVTTDNLGMALFFACGWALTRPEPRDRIPAALILPAAVVLVRHIYLPALIALPLWCWLTQPLRRDAVVAALVGVACFAPFFIVWGGLTPPNFSGVHRTGVYLSNVLAMCAFAAFMLVLMAPMLDHKRLAVLLHDRRSYAVAGSGALAGLAFCALAPHSFDFDPSRWQDGALLYLLDRKLAALGPLGVLAIRGFVVVGAIVLALLTWIVWCDRERRYATGFIVLHLAALCLQERPYQRYFESPMVLSMLMVLAPFLRSRVVFAIPLMAVWLLQSAIYLKRLF